MAWYIFLQNQFALWNFLSWLKAPSLLAQLPEPGGPPWAEPMSFSHVISSSSPLVLPQCRSSSWLTWVTTTTISNSSPCHHFNSLNLLQKPQLAPHFIENKVQIPRPGIQDSMTCFCLSLHCLIWLSHIVTSQMGLLKFKFQLSNMTWK